MENLRRTALLVLGSAVAAVLLVGTTAAAQGAIEGPEDPLKDGVEYEWWDEQWHMRVPVLVRPQMPDTVVDGHRPVLEEVEDIPVHAEVDFTSVIRQVGDSPDERWPQSVDGSLNSFTFDPDSVRLVRYDRDSGAVVPHERTGDEVPSRFLPTLLERRNLQNDRFDPSSNAVGTVTWIAEDTLENPRLYFVYFDIEENGDKAPPEYTPSEKGPLDSLNWIRPGTDAYGYVPQASSDAPRLEVHGLYPNTAVQVKRYPKSGFDPVPLESCEESSSSLCVEQGERIDDVEEPTFEVHPLSDASRPSRVVVPSPSDVGYFFHVEADKPVLVATRSHPPPGCPNQLFYPGNQGLVSESFLFANLNGEPDPSCSSYEIRLMAPQDDARVEWTYPDRGGRPADGSPFTVGAGKSKTVSLPNSPLGEPIRVEASAPVAIAQAGYGSVGSVGTQIPSLQGAPVGERTLGPLYKELSAVTWETESEVTTFNVNDPTDDDARLSGASGPGAADPVTLRNPSPFDRYKGEVWSTSAEGSEPISVYHGDEGITPLGGEDGRRFKVPMDKDDGDPFDPNRDEPKRMILFPVYDRTGITVVDNASETTVFDGTANQHGFLDQQSGEYHFPARQSGEEDKGYHVETTKPILAYRMNGDSGYASYYPTVTTSPLYEVGQASFHGNLIRWGESLRTPTMAPGQEKTFTLSVTNLGREIGGGNLPDDVRFKQEVVGNGSVTLSSQEVSGLDSFESRSLKVVVEIPEEAETGDSLVVNVTAISQGNPDFEAFTQLKITVKTLFRVEMSFRSDDCNPKSCERLVESGSSTLYAIDVNNTGTGDDSYEFSFTESQGGFEAKVETLDGRVLAADGESKGSLSVPRGESKIVFFNVTGPEDTAGAFPYETQVQARSQNDTSKDAQDFVTATTVLSVNTNFRLEVDDDTEPVTPGENATFHVRAVNEGDDTVLDVRTSEPSLSGWNVSADPPSFLLRANGTTAPDGTKGFVRTVAVNVTASDDARVGQILPLEVAAVSQTSQGTTAEESVQVRAVVENNFTLATSGLGPRSLKPGETFRYQFTVRNAANGPFDVTVNATGLPDGWRFEKEAPEGRTSLDVGETLDVAGDLVLPAGTPAGEYNVTFSFFGETDDGDRGVTNATGVVQVSRRARLDVTPPADPAPVPPGNRTRVPLNVTNAGNVDLTARLSLSAPEGWGIAFLNASRQQVPLDAGESTTVDVVLQAPEGIGDGPVEWGVEADLPLRNPQSFVFGADWIRRDLQVVDAQPVTDSFEPGTVNVVAVTLRNDGNLPANNVDVAILVDGSPVSNLTVETLPPGEERVVQVDWTVPDGATRLEVAVDPQDEFRETDETNNVRSFSPAAESAIPTPSPALAALAVAGLILVRRRWSP